MNTLSTNKVASLLYSYLHSPIMRTKICIVPLNPPKVCFSRTSNPEMLPRANLQASVKRKVEIQICPRNDVSSKVRVQSRPIHLAGPAARPTSCVQRGGSGSNKFRRTARQDPNSNTAAVRKFQSCSGNIHEARLDGRLGWHSLKKKTRSSRCSGSFCLSGRRLSRSRLLFLLPEVGEPATRPDFPGERRHGPASCP